MKIRNGILAFILSMSLLGLSPIAQASVLSLLTDSVNSGIINTKMVANHSLSGIDVNATVINGIAVFSGQVNSKAQIEELIHIARSVSGIRGINVSKLRITPQISSQ
ncbi:MAG: BON domain-containing protein [Gammaproteobacteria bacterium]|nr:MAG: BON domain-containing protein [Gammaproteobacteria bacterium]